MKIRYLSHFLIFCLAIFPVYALFGCTGIFLKTKDQGYVYARTLEFGVDLNSQILFIPRNYAFTAAAEQADIKGLAWHSRYAVIGVNAFGSENYVDGVNEAGLAGGLFYFPGFAGCQTVKEANYPGSLPMWQLLTWILTSFKDVGEVRAALPKIYVTDVIFPEFKGPVPAHLIVHDLTGKSLVIEYVDGKLNLHDNPLGIFTNAPDFGWHLTNLQNYINLSSVNAKSKELLGVNLAPLSQGSGMHGLPGDFTSPSRFVRVAQFVANASTPKNELDAVYEAFHILNNFDIPKGFVVDEHGNAEFTSWTSAIDLKNKIFYFKNYANFQLQKFELNKIDLNSKTAQQFSMQHADHIIERN